MRFFFEYAFFLPKLYVFFPDAFFLHIRFLYVFQQNYTYLCVFLCVFLALPRIIRFFSILKTGHHVIVRLYAGTYYEYDLFNGHNKKKSDSMSILPQKLLLKIFIIGRQSL